MVTVELNFDLFHCKYIHNKKKFHGVLFPYVCVGEMVGIRQVGLRFSDVKKR